MVPAHTTLRPGSDFLIICSHTSPGTDGSTSPIAAKGDLHVDEHHTVEDVGICLGKALNEALGDKRGIERFGAEFVTMDEALARTVVDLSGRSYVVFDAVFSRDCSTGSRSSLSTNFSGPSPPKGG